MISHIILFKLVKFVQLSVWYVHNTHVVSLPVVCSLQGAGDAFVGSLAHHLARDVTADVTSCLQKCVDIASISVQANGTQSSYPYSKDLPAHLL